MLFYKDENEKNSTVNHTKDFPLGNNTHASCALHSSLFYNAKNGYGAIYGLLSLFLVIKRLFFCFRGKILRERGEKEAFPLFPVSYSAVLILYSFLYFFSLVGSPGREYTASLIVHVLMQIFSVLFLSTYLRKGTRHEK